jgi:citrate synthase
MMTKTYNTEGNIPTYISLEEMLFIIWKERRPKENELVHLQIELSKFAVKAFRDFNQNETKMKYVAPLNVLRVALWNLDKEEQRYSPYSEFTFPTCAKILIFLTVQLLNSYRASLGEPFLAPKRNASYAYNVLLMLKGNAPEMQEVQVMSWILTWMANNNDFLKKDNAQDYLKRDDPYETLDAAIEEWGNTREHAQLESILTWLYHVKNEMNIQAKIPDNSACPPGFGDVQSPIAHQLDTMWNELAKSKHSISWYNSIKKVELLGEKLGYFPSNEYFIANLLFELGVPTALYPAFTILCQIPGCYHHLISLRHA